MSSTFANAPLPPYQYQQQIVPHYGGNSNQYTYQYQQQQQPPQYGYDGYGQQPQPEQETSDVDTAFATPSRSSVIQSHDPYAVHGTYASTPTAPPPPSDTELALMAFEQLDAPNGPESAPQPCVVSPSSSEEMTPYTPQDNNNNNSTTTDDAMLARIIASQQLAMERAATGRQARHDSPPASRHMVVSDYESSYGGYAMTPYENGTAIQTGVHPHRKQMKQQRKVKTGAGVVGGAVVGGLTLGPVGVVLGGAAGGYATRAIAKSGEKRAQRKFEQRNVQEAAAHSRAVRGASFT